MPHGFAEVERRWLPYVEIVAETENMVRINLLCDDAHALGSSILARRVVAPVLQVHGRQKNATHQS